MSNNSATTCPCRSCKYVELVQWENELFKNASQQTEYNVLKRNKRKDIFVASFHFDSDTSVAYVRSTSRSMMRSKKPSHVRG